MTKRARTTSGPSSGPQPRGRNLAQSGKSTKAPKRHPHGPIGELAPAWLSELLKIACVLPVEKGPDEVSASLVERLSGLVPSYGLGVSLGKELERGQPARAVCAAQAGVPIAAGKTPGRLFPQFRNERLYPVKHEHETVHLHVAAGDAAQLADGTPIELLMSRAAEVLASALRTTRLVSAQGRESLELKEQIIQSGKLASVGQMAAGVVHELTNPLTSIVGYSDYLRKKTEREHGDAGDVERLRRIGESAGRILRFARDLIAYARPSIEPPSPVAIHSVIDQALVFCEHELDRAHIRVERAFAPNITPVFGVRDQLTQVFVNLFTNACHAMDPAGGTLAVTTQPDGPRRTVRVSVCDSGHGIERENLNRVFEPFFTTKTDGRGTGLGLSIVRNIVLLHGGAISVESEPAGGTTFFVELPVAP